MQKWPVVLIIGILALTVILSGCINLTVAPQQTVPVITPMQTVVTTPSPITTAATTLPTHTQTKTVATTTPIPTAAANLGPLDAPVHLKSNLPPEEKISFTTVRPGKVKIHVYCLIPGKAVLTSASMDQVLLQAKSSPGESKDITINLVTPQTYWISISGFNKADIGLQKMWAVDVTNA